MAFSTLSEFLCYLESIGELQRVTREVDPYLEITELATRAVREGKPALLFERVKGSRFPLAINVYASEKRIELALGRHPERIGEELVAFAEHIVPPSFSALWSERKMLRRFLAARPRLVRNALSQEVVTTAPDLNLFPLQVCWPGDGGRFVTQGQVFTVDPQTQKRNVGMYRMHVYDEKTTGMHWQIQKGGGFHYRRAEELNRPLEVAVALGTSPALLLATVSALPEGIDEVLFAAFLQGKPIPLTKAKTLSLAVPAEAEFILEGIVQPHERRLEGPFGDHFGHYSLAAPFPVFHLQAITHRKNPVYPATVVGILPMEDKYLGDATQQILAPLTRVLFHEVRSVWAYYEAGFHNLLVASVDVRYKKEALKTSFGLLGTGQLSLTKCLILVSKEVNPRDWRAVLREIKNHFNPETDLHILSNVPLDTLDFTSRTMEIGSKMILDATRKNITQRPEQIHEPHTLSEHSFRELDNRILKARSFEDTLLVVQVTKEGREVLEKLVAHPVVQKFSLLAVVSEDIDLGSDENTIWGIFTRFDCVRDIVFSEQTFVGTVPRYSGVVGIDATWKEGYPEPLKMDESIVRHVDTYWDTLWSTQ